MLDEETRRLLKERNFQALFEKGPDVWNEATNEENLPNSTGIVELNFEDARSDFRQYVFRHPVKIYKMSDRAALIDNLFLRSVTIFNGEFENVYSFSGNEFRAFLAIDSCKIDEFDLLAFESGKLSVRSCDIRLVTSIYGGYKGKNVVKVSLHFSDSLIKIVEAVKLEFSSKIDFSNIKEKMDVFYVRGCIFSSQFSLWNVFVGGQVAISENRFLSDVQFLNVEFEKIPVLESNKFQISPDKKYVSTYRFLRREALRSQDFAAELDFAAEEMRARQMLLRDSKRLEDKAYVYLTISYRLASNFGRSFLRPLSILIATFFVFAALFGVWVPCLREQSFQYSSGLVLSLASALPFVGQSRFGFQNAIERLCAVSPGSADLDPSCANWVYGISVVEGLLSLILIFLIGLGLRNQFRIK